MEEHSRASAVDFIIIALTTLLVAAGVWFFDFAETEAQENTAPTPPRISVTPEAFLFWAGNRTAVLVRAHDADEDELTYTIDFGDGAETETSPPTPTNERWGFVHTWAEPGTYEISVGVVDGRGGEATSTQEVQFAARDELPPPYLKITKEQKHPPELRVLDVARFFVRSEDPDDKDIIYRVEFGNGKKAENDERPLRHVKDKLSRWTWDVLHNYKDPGLYTVTATVENEDGDKAQTVRQLRVLEGQGAAIPGDLFGPDLPGDTLPGGNIPDSGVLTGGIPLTGPRQVFGGRIEHVEKCSCIGQDGQEGVPVSYGKLIQVGPPNPGRFVVIKSPFFGFGSQVYAHKKIELNHWVLGDAVAAPIPCNKTEIQFRGGGPGLVATPVPVCKTKEIAPAVVKIGTGAEPAEGSGGESAGPTFLP